MSMDFLNLTLASKGNKKKTFRAESMPMPNIPVCTVIRMCYGCLSWAEQSAGWPGVTHYSRGKGLGEGPLTTAA